jgi:hypothetical protein
MLTFLDKIFKSKSLGRLLAVGGPFGAGKSIMTEALLKDPRFVQLRSHTTFDLHYQYIRSSNDDGKEVYTIQCFDGRLPRQRKSRDNNVEDIVNRYDVFTHKIDPLVYIPEDKREVYSISDQLNPEALELLSEAHKKDYLVENLNNAEILTSDLALYAFHDWNDFKQNLDDGVYVLTGKVPSETSKLGAFGPRCYSLTDFAENEKQGLFSFCEIVDTSIPETIGILDGVGIETKALVINPSEADGDFLLRVRKNPERILGNQKTREFKDTKPWLEMVEIGRIIPLEVSSRVSLYNIDITVPLRDGSNVRVLIEEGQIFTPQPDGNVLVQDAPQDYIGDEERNLTRFIEEAEAFFKPTETETLSELNTVLRNLIPSLCAWVKRRTGEGSESERRNR